MTARTHTTRDTRASSGTTDAQRADAILQRAVDEALERRDGWTNILLGFGGEGDKTARTAFGAGVCRLTEPQLVAMYATEDMSAKIVDVYPREALRVGFEIGGLETEGDTEDEYAAPETEPGEPVLDAYKRRRDRRRDAKAKSKVENEVSKYIHQKWNVCQRVLEWAIWGRLMGISAILLGTAEAPESWKNPLPDKAKITFLRGIDARWLTANGEATNLDNEGNPILYRISPPNDPKSRQGSPEVHASRLVIFPGALTDQDARISMGYRDYSVLQRALDALTMGGEIWKSSRALLSEASVPILKIENLWSMLTSGKIETVKTRLRQFNLNRQISKAIPLDAKEEYERINTSFAGIADLTEAGMKRIASAAEMPLTILMGEAPGGLNSTGDSDLRWFLNRVDAYRKHVLERLILRIVKVLLESPDSPYHGSTEDLCIRWPELWTPSATERADIYQKTQQADSGYLNDGILTREEITASRFGDDGYSQDTEVDLDERAAALEDEAAIDPNDPALAGATDPNADPSMQGEPADANADPGIPKPAGHNPAAKPGAPPAAGEPGTTAPGAPGGPKPAAPGVAPAAGVAPPGQQAPAGQPNTPAGSGTNIQQQVLNGTQVSSLVDIVTQVAAKTLPRDAAIQIIMLAYQVDQPTADKLCGSAGTTFTVEPPPPPAPFGGKPPGEDGPPKPDDTNAPPAGDTPPGDKPNPFAKK